MAVEDTQESQWQAIFEKVKKDCPDKNHVPRHAKDELEKAEAHFTCCPKANGNRRPVPSRVPKAPETALDSTRPMQTQWGRAGAKEAD